MNRADAERLLKTVYSEPTINHIVRHTDCLDFFNQKSKVKYDTAGAHIETSHLYADPEGVGARKEEDYIPQPTDALADRNKIYLKYLYMTVRLTKQVMKDMRRGPGAFLSWAQVTLENVAKAMKNDLDRQIQGYGSGIIARVNKADPDAADFKVNVDDAYGTSKFANGAAELFRPQAQYIFSPNANGSSPRASGGVSDVSIVKAVDWKNDIVTFDTVSSRVADDDYIFRGDKAGNNAPAATATLTQDKNKEIMGLLGHIDDGTILNKYFDFERDAKEEFYWLKSQIYTATGGNVTEGQLQLIVDELEQYAGGEPDVLLGSRNVWRNYFAQMKDDRTFNDPRSYVGGAKKLSIYLSTKEYPIKTGNRIPRGTMYILDTSTLERAQTKGLEWSDQTGSIWHQEQDSTGVKDAFFAYGNWFLETFCTAPNRSARLDGVT